MKYFIFIISILAFSNSYAYEPGSTADRMERAGEISDQEFSDRKTQRLIEESISTVNRQYNLQRQYINNQYGYPVQGEAAYQSGYAIGRAIGQ